MTRLIFRSADDVKAYEVRAVGVSDWILVDQDRIKDVGLLREVIAD